MEQRTLIAVIISIFIIIGYQYLVSTKFAPPPEIKKPPQTVQDSPKVPESTPRQASFSSEKTKKKSLSRVKPREVTIETDLYQAVITEEGARLKGFILKKYRQSVDKDSPPVNLVTSPSDRLPLEVSLSAKPGLSVALFLSPKTKIDLTGERHRASIPFIHEAEGIFLAKEFTFKKDSYLIEFTARLRNDSQQVIKDRLSIHLFNRPFVQNNRYVFVGPAYYAHEFTEVKLKKPGATSSYSGEVSWVAYQGPYFMMALLPKDHLSWELNFKRWDEKTVETKLVSPPLILKPGEVKDFRFSLYFGPKEIERLKAIGRDLDKAIDFGFFTPIAKPLLYVLKFFYRFVHNYGIAIILLTAIIKLIFWPLSHHSYKSMQQMQKLQPHIARLKEKYGHDKERLNRELMNLYRSYKINPLSGCLPMLLQIPVFFALYKVLLAAIELRHAPFALWINDLSAPDRLYIGFDIPFLGGVPVLTILMGASMYFQQKMSPSSLDPMQQKMMSLMPLLFTVMFVNFPSGLVLYWLVNNVLSIVQQYYINKKLA
ncbi:membrane protein insertase YidC [Thermosulfuriphilus sp.]